MHMKDGGFRIKDMEDICLRRREVGGTWLRSCAGHLKSQVSLLGA